MGWQVQKLMGWILEFGLISALGLAVLAFGGTDSLYFSVVQILLLGLSIRLLLRYRTPRAEKPAFPIVVPALLVALIVVQMVPLPAALVALFRSASDLPRGTSTATLSIAPDQTLSHLLLLLTYVGAFYLGLAVCQRRNGSRHLVLALLALGAFEAFYGLVQYLTGWQQIFTYVKTFSVEEATGTYINRNHFAGLLEMILPFALALAFYQFAKLAQAQPESSAWVRNRFGSAEFQKLIFWLFLAVILFTALVFSRSRMGILAALFSTLVVVTLMAAAAKQKTAGTVLVVFFLAAGFLMALWIGPEPVLGRFEALSQEYTLSPHSRWAIWQDTLPLIRQHPWLGSGFGTFPVDYTSAQSVYPGMFVNHAHNDYLEIFAELGVSGGLVLFGSVFYLLAQTIRRYRVEKDRWRRAMALGSVGSLVAMLSHSLTDFNLYIPANALVFAVVSAIAWSSTRPLESEVLKSS